MCVLCAVCTGDRKGLAAMCVCQCLMHVISLYEKYGFISVCGESRGCMCL